MMNAALAIALFAVFLLALLALIIFMFVSLGRQGDERRRMIVEKAGFGTMNMITAYLLFCAAENMILVCSGKNLSPEGLNPFTTLSVVAILYACHLAWYKRKYGD